MSLKVYTYRNCSTCKQAIKWLTLHKVSFQELAIRETPPSLAELKRMLTAVDGEIRKLFNTSGSDYKSMNLKARLSSMSTENALKLLQENGNLVKRPFVSGAGVSLVGFNAEVWEKALK